jgi:hypothetical protein
MPRHCKDLADNLAIKYNRLEIIRSKLESLHQRNEITESEISTLYEVLFLNTYTSFEVFLDELFFGLLVERNRLKTAQRDIHPLIKLKSQKVARKIVTLPNYNYIDWFPYKKTSKMAEKYFRKGRPFTKLDIGETGHLGILYVIRNAIAHKSEHSLNEFKTLIGENRVLRAGERNPGGYLRGVFRTAPNQTRYENYVAKTLMIAQKLSH